MDTNEEAVTAMASPFFGRPGLAGQVILITGASSGIGAALAREFGRRGARLALLARRRERLEELCRDIESGGGGEALAIPCDVTVDGELEAAAARTVERFGRLDVVVANAGFGVRGIFEHLEIEDYRRQFETNVFGVLRTVGATLEALKASRGRLVILGSVNGHVVLPSNSAYGMSKFAVRSFAESLAYELLPYGVSVTHVSPGFVATEIHQVQNDGERDPERRDRRARRFVLSAETAARKIADATASRRRQLTLTALGHAALWLERFAPWLLRAVLRRLLLKAYREDQGRKTGDETS